MLFGEFVVTDGLIGVVVRRSKRYVIDIVDVWKDLRDNNTRLLMTYIAIISVTPYLLLSWLLTSMCFTSNSYTGLSDWTATSCPGEVEVHEALEDFQKVEYKFVYLWLSATSV